MSTRCEIGILNEDGTIEAAYCHHDGYIFGGVGETLYSDYNGEANRNKIKKLIAGGAMSSLQADPSDCYFYNDGQENVVYQNEEEFLKNFDVIERRYLFMQDGTWWFAEPGDIDYKSLDEHFNPSEF